MPQSLFRRSRLLASEVPERMCLCRSLVLTFELPIKSGCLWSDTEKGDGFLEFVGGGVF
jgi:hypothetical protein